MIQTIEKIFATTYSASVQATIWDIAKFLIENIPEVCDCTGAYGICLANSGVLRYNF